ncbi:MAG TPA: hypothetical protein VJU79_08485 [Candidatus Dormibacteraeota bacterium]|nr:hypothetical protein [Candidatus Dormibacteraeota bacterium]
MSAVSLAVLVALVVASAQASPPAQRVAPRVKTVRGSLSLTVTTPSPACGEFTYAGSCDFEPTAKVKVNSARECRARDVKIYRVDVRALVTTPGTTRRGVATTHLGGRYTALYPGVPTNNPVYEPTGGTKMSFRAVSARFRAFEANNPLRPVVCKALKTAGVDEVAVPMPPPPDF